MTDERNSQRPEIASPPWLPALDLPLSHRPFELFALARAGGATALEAAAQAGHARPAGKAAEVDRHSRVRARIATLLVSRAGRGSRDIGGVIDQLLALARKASDAGEAKAWDVARECLADAARLKENLPVTPEPFRPPVRQLTIEEWRARHDRIYRHEPTAPADPP